MRFLRPADFRLPDSPERLFGRAGAPWHLEVGFGDGRFWAAQHRLEDANYLGVEVSGVSVLKALARYRAAGVERAVLARVAAE